MDPKYIYVIETFKHSFGITDEIDIGYGTTDHKINIKASNTNFFNCSNLYDHKKTVWKDWKGRKIPFLFDDTDSHPIIELKDEKVIINYDIVASSFFFLSGWQEAVYMRKHQPFRFPYDASIQNLLNIANTAVVNHYFDILMTGIQRIYSIPLSRSPWGPPPFAISLTHDVDRIESGWLEEGISEIRKGRPATIFNLLYKRLFDEDIWFNFDRILSIERESSVKSSFYFMTQREGILKSLRALLLPKKIPTNSDYNIFKHKYCSLVRKLIEAGCEIGIHGSISSHLDAEKLKSEITRLGVDVSGGRFHYLCFDMNRTFDVLEQADLKYDSTLGFSNSTGFRNGIAFPFHPFDFKKNRAYRIIELPLIIMDHALRKKENFPGESTIDTVKSLLDEIESVNGCLTVLWHNNYFSDHKYRGWERIYKYIIEEGKRRGALFLTGREAIEQWLLKG